MVSFGCGMTDNDVAMRAIDEFIATHFEGSLDEDYETIGTLPSQEVVDEALRGLSEEFLHGYERDYRLLGLADFLLGHGYGIGVIEGELMVAYDRQLEQCRRWTHPDVRRSALHEFIAKVDES